MHMCLVSSPKSVKTAIVLGSGRIFLNVLINLFLSAVY